MEDIQVIISMRSYDKMKRSLEDYKRSNKLLWQERDKVRDQIASQFENRIKELESTNNRLRTENEELKAKLTKASKKWWQPWKKIVYG